MIELFGRLQEATRSARLLASSGATATSIALYPLRRRARWPRNQVDFRAGGSLVAPPGEPLMQIVREVWADRCYTPPGFEIRPGDAVVDVGAHVGAFTVLAAISAPRVTVTAVEPSPSLAPWLRRNVARNRLRNVRIVEAACGAEPGRAMLYGRGPECANSLHDGDVANGSVVPIAETAVIRLADVVDQLPGRACDFLKMDCEGAEYEILLGAEDGLLARIRLIAMEYHLGFDDHRPEELDSLLRSHGFEVTLSPLPEARSGYLYARRLS